MPKNNYTYEVKEINGQIYRKCIHCEKFKLLFEFYVDKTKKLGTRAYCKECHAIKTKEYRELNKEKINARRIEKSYGITLEQFNKLKIKQNNVCAICKESMLVYRGAQIDHCHDTLKVRGLLCLKCNLGIGSFNPNSLRMLNALIYLLEIPESQSQELQRFFLEKNK